jgi:hypothetical protein
VGWRVTRRYYGLSPSGADGAGCLSRGEQGRWRELGRDPLAIPLELHHEQAVTSARSNWPPDSRHSSLTASAIGMRPAVRPVVRHRVERVDDPDDPGAERDGLARGARPGSRGRPSVRGGGGRSARTSRPTTAAGRSARRSPGDVASAPTRPTSSGLGLVRIASGTPILPTSWSSAPYATASSSIPSRPPGRPIERPGWQSRWQWRSV